MKSLRWIALAGLLLIPPYAWAQVQESANDTTNTTVKSGPTTGVQGQQPRSTTKAGAYSASTTPTPSTKPTASTYEKKLTPTKTMAEATEKPITPASTSATKPAAPASSTAAKSATTAAADASKATSATPAASGDKKGEYSFGDFTSETLATKAWDALNAGDHKGVEVYTKKALSLYENKAIDMSKTVSDFPPKDKAFSYWALNDVATCYFILGKSLQAQGKDNEAREAYKTIVDKFPYAQCWDPKGWFWKVASAAKDQMALIGTKYDFGDYTSQTLTTKAWEALESEDHKAVDLYTKKNFELYEAKAKEQQASLKDFAPKDKAFDYWALNDVGTSYFILGKSLLAQGKVDEAKEAFNTVIQKFPYAQCWDVKGWFWKVAQGAQDQLSTIGTPYDFGDYTSMTLTTKAWEALGAQDAKGVEVYAKKCIQLYEEDAKKQQAALTGFAPKEKAFDSWALNDVATCYFILGQSYMDQKKYPEAKAAFERVVNDFGYAQCWDPKGWFWKVAVGARGQLNKLLALSGS